MKTLFAIAVCCLGQQAVAGEYKNELNAIMMVETSGGQNLNHRPIKRGIHAGTQAAGRFGIMPISGKEFVTKNPSPRRDLQYLKELDHSEFVAELNANEQVDFKLAKRMWLKLRTTRDARQAACAWYRGPYADRCRNEELLEQDIYVQQFMQYLRGPANVDAQESK